VPVLNKPVKAGKMRAVLSQLLAGRAPIKELGGT